MAEEKKQRRDFMFEVGDIVKVTTEGMALCPLGSDKSYSEHLKVEYRFRDCLGNVYVLNTGDDGISVICQEHDLGLEERAEALPADGRDEQAPMDGRNKVLYRVTNGIGQYYVVSRSFNEASELLQRRLERADYGYTDRRKVKSIDLIASEHFYRDKQLFCDSDYNLIVED